MYRLGKHEITRIIQARGKYHEDPKWYCVMVNCGQEKKIRDAIHKAFPAREGVEVFLPVLQRLTPGSAGNSVSAGGGLLFHGYIFLRCRMTDRIYMAVSACKGVVSILGSAYRVPLALDDREMIILQTLPAADAGQVLTVWPEGNSKAVVTSGLLKGLEGRVLEFDDEAPKVAFRLSFLGREKGIVLSLPRTQLKIEHAVT